MNPVNLIDIEGDDDIIPLSLVSGRVYLHNDQTNYVGGYDMLTVGDKSNKLVFNKGPYYCRLSDYAKECMNSKILKFQFVLSGIKLELPAWGMPNTGWMGGITKNQPADNQMGGWGGDLGHLDLPDVNSGQTSNVTCFDITEPFDNLYLFVKKYRDGESTAYPMLIINMAFKSGYYGMLIPKWGDWS